MEMDQTTIGIIVVVICLFISSSIGIFFITTTPEATTPEPTTPEPTTTTFAPAPTTTTFAPAPTTTTFAPAPTTTTAAPTTMTAAPTTTTAAPTTTTFAPTPTTTTASPTTTTAAPTTTTAARTTTTAAPIQYWNCYLNSNNTRQDSWNDNGSGGGLGGFTQINASNTCNAWVSNCGNYGGCTAYKVGTKPSTT